MSKDMKEPRAEEAPAEPIAIIGMGCRFPGGADSPDTFWNLMRDGVNAISEVPPDRWNMASFFHPEPGQYGKTYSRWGGFLSQIDQFDAGFFGISPREASAMDPQQRLLLEVSWEALEDGGQVLEELEGSSTGVFVGISTHDYSDIQVKDSYIGNSYTNSGGALSIAANRVSYAFNLHGPSMAVDTACSSALVAVHLACRSIWDGESSMALAGGVNCIITPEPTIGFSKANMLSPDGSCKTFDAGANGYVRGEGAGAVLLKPLSQAVADGDRIYAVIRATGVNQDGKTSGLTVPSLEAQAALLKDVYARAQVSPDDVLYIEAHGTGTPVGDPIEAQAIGAALGGARTSGEPLRVGSVKTNIGHLEAASGMAGLSKAAMLVQRRELLPNLHFSEPNPHIPFEKLNLRVQTQREVLPEGSASVVGINSFGFGGTNAHVVLDSVPLTSTTTEQHPATAKSDSYLIPLSARSPEALRQVATRVLAMAQDAAPEFDLADLAFSAGVRRSHHSHRLGITAESLPDLAEHLQAYLQGDNDAAVRVGQVSARSPRLAFVFSGMGPQWSGMAQELLKDEPCFRHAVEEADALFRPLAGWSLIDALNAGEADSRMAMTEVAQPANFAVQLGLAALWASWGIVPEAIVGHSAGEVAAAYIAGILSLKDAVTVIYHRSRLQQRATGKGKMLAVGLSESEAIAEAKAHGDLVSVAAVNSPRAVTLSGDEADLAEIAEKLQARRLFARFMDVDVPYHSHHMDPLKDELFECLGAIQPQTARIPYYSVVTGGRADGSEIDASYWWRNVRHPVEFAGAIEEMLEDSYDTFVELSPQPVLSRSVNELQAHLQKKATVVGSLRRGYAERATLLGSLATLYTLGCRPKWRNVNPGGNFIKMPAYPWQRERHWNEAPVSSRFRLASSLAPLLERRLNTAALAWETRLDAYDLAYLVDHQVQGSVLFPAAGYIEAALEATRQLKPDGAITLEDIEFRRPLVLQSGAFQSIQVSLDAHDGTFAINGHLKDSPTWTLHASGRVSQGPASRRKPASVDIDKLRCRDDREIDAETCYEVLAEQGLQYGPNFRLIEHLWLGRGEALGRLQLPESLVGDAEAYQIQPALLDACFQVLIGAVLFEQAEGVAAGTYVPVAISQIRVFKRLTGGTLWSHARLKSRSASSLVGDFTIVDENGERVAEIRGLRCQAIPDARSAVKPDDLLFELRWEETALASPIKPANVAGPWLIFADREGFASGLAESLSAMKGTSILVQQASEYRRLSETCFEVRPGSAEDIEAVLEDVGARGALRGIVHLWSLDSPDSRGADTATLQAVTRRGSISVLQLVQSLSARPGLATTRLWLVTRGAQAATDELLPGVLQAPLWGLGRVIMNEHPYLRCTLVDLDAAGSPDQAEALREQLAADDPEQELCLRGDRRYIARVARPALEEDGAENSDAAMSTAGDAPYRLQVRRQGSLDSLFLQQEQRRTPRRGEVEVEILASALNFRDVMKAMGLYPSDPGAPFWLGDEAAGRVVRCGAGVIDVKPDDEVIVVGPGCFGSFITVPSELVVRKPSGLTMEQAATLPIVFMTAHYALNHLARIRKGDRVLIHSAAGGVGIAAVQLAQLAGAEVFATAGSPEKRRFLRSMGVKHVMDSRSLDFAEETMRLTNGKGVSVVLNSLAGEFIPKSLSLLEPTGRFLELGKVDLYQNSKLGLWPFRSGLSFFTIDLAYLLEHQPELARSLLSEVVEMFESGSLQAPPIETFPMAEASKAFRYMAQAQHIGKIVLTPPAAGERVVEASTSDKPLFRRNATYMITGGTSGFGLATAEWMVRQGAKNLLLVSRRGLATPEAEAAVARLRRDGANVVGAQADVSRPEDVERLVNETCASLPPLRGVLHCAMVLDDGYLLQLDEQRFESVMAPKAYAAWNLHRATSGKRLDYFVLFSSITSWVGTVGQGNYAAANALLDALAQHRRACGLPGLSVHWGAIADAGYVARNPTVARQLDRQGVLSIKTSDATEVLGRLLRDEAREIGVARMDFTSLKAAGTLTAAQRRFAPLLTAAADATGSSISHAGHLLELLQPAPAEEQQAQLEKLLTREVSKVLGIPESNIEPDQDLTNLGLDSLMSVEIEIGLENELGADLPLGFLLGEEITVRELSKKLRELIPASTDDPPPGGEVVAQAMWQS